MDRKYCVFRFSGVEVREREFSVAREGEVVRVEPKAFRVLLFFLHNPGKLITKDELVNAVWDDAAVTDNSLTRSIALLRRVLGDDPAEPRFIATVPTVGYRFLAPVETSDDALGSLEYLPASAPGNAEDPISSPPVPQITSQIGHPPVDSSPRWSLVGVALLLLAVGLAQWLRRHASQSEASESQLTRHSSDNPLSGVAISPDGKYLLFADSAGIHITLLQTGEVRDIPWHSEPGQSLTQWLFRWFPDSSRFLATKLERADPPVIWQGSVLASRLKKVREGAVAWTISPDGSSIVLTKASPVFAHVSDLWLADSNGNDLRKLDDAGLFDFVQWSPNGDRLAYLRHIRKAGEFHVSIETRDLKGGPPVTLLSDNALRRLYWLPDGRLLYVVGESARTAETCNYWVAHLNPTQDAFSAAPKQLTHNTNTGFCISETSATSDSKKLVFLKRAFETSVYVADLDPGAKRISPPRPLTSTEGQEWPVGWTPDSREVVFASNRGPKMGFFRQPLTGGEATPILTGIESTALGDLFGRVTPDGAWLLYESFPNGYVPGTPMDLKKVSMSGGTPQVILRDALFDTPRCAQLPSRLCAFATVDKDQLVFWSVDPVTGRGPELGRFKMEPKPGSGWALSPDGTRIAIQRGGDPEIHILSIATHTVSTITVKGWVNGIALDWTADGSGFFICPLQPRAVLLYVDLEGNATPLWEPKGSNTTWALPSPDGRHVAMPSAAISSNAWIIQHF